MFPQAQGHHVIAIYREPFALGTPTTVKWREGWSVLDMAAEMDFLPDNFLEEGYVLANGKIIPTEKWDKYVPATHEITNITFHAPIQGGGGGGGKKAFALVAALALTVVTYGVGSGALLGTLSASVGTAFGVSAATGAAILAGGISLVGSLAISALSAPPVNRNDQAASGGDDGSGAIALNKASLNGNVLEPNASVPRVVGTRRVFPPFAYEPVTEIIGQDEYVTATYVLGGPHKLEDIRIGTGTVDETAEDADVHITTYDGRPQTTPVSIPEIQGRTFNLGFEMSKHGVSPDDGQIYDEPLPVYHAMTTANSPDQAWLHMMLQGLIYQPSPSSLLRIPIRIRMRKLGDTSWRDLPELHYAEATQSQRRLQIKFVFRALASGITTPRSDRGFIEARKSVPAQNVAPLGTVFNCDSYFSSGSGGDVYSQTTVGTTKVINMTLEPDVATFYLDPASWPAGAYEIQIKRGSAFLESSFTSSTYTYSGTVRDFFGNLETNLLPLNTEDVLDRMILTRLVSVRFRLPIRQANLAMINIVARNRSVDRLSVLASGYVRNWNGTNWGTIETTSNPAAHYLDVLTGQMNFDPIPEELIDFESLQDWWDRCNTEGHTCDMVVDSSTVFDTMRTIASCGYARPYQSEIWGVIQDYDRSAETPVQIFTSRNSSGLNWKKALPRLPSGLRINYADILYDYEQRQVSVYRDGQLGNDARIEQTTYEGITDIDKVIQRGRFDLRQGQFRSAIYSLSTSAEAVKCRKGSLVGINHDLVSKMRGAARIVEVLYDTSGDIEGVILDQALQVTNETLFGDVSDFRNIQNVSEVGLRTGMTIRRSNGQFSTHEVKNPTGETNEIYFTTPFPDDITDGSVWDKGNIRQVREGCLVTIGELNTVEKRYIVTEIENGEGLSANLTLVDEAPELWS